MYFILILHVLSSSSVGSTPFLLPAGYVIVSNQTADTEKRGSNLPNLFVLVSMLEYLSTTYLLGLVVVFSIET